MIIMCIKYKTNIVCIIGLQFVKDVSISFH